MTTTPPAIPSRPPTVRQRSLRRRASRLPLTGAVRLAADVFFSFGSSRGSALWSQAEHVWLGRETFLYWALEDGEMNVPWVVTHAADAPQDEESLYRTVRGELIAYWTERLSALPRFDKPAWLALP